MATNKYTFLRTYVHKSSVNTYIHKRFGILLWYNMCIVDQLMALKTVITVDALAFICLYFHIYTHIHVLYMPELWEFVSVFVHVYMKDVPWVWVYLFLVSVISFEWYVFNQHTSVTRSCVWVRMSERIWVHDGSWLVWQITWTFSSSSKLTGE